MTVKDIDLGKGAVATMHSGTGEDALKSLAVRAKMQGYLDEYNVIGGFTFQLDYATIIAQTDALTGLEFQLPAWTADGVELAAGFRAWLGLSKKRLELWRSALSDLDEELNDPDLLPLEKVAAANVAAPLSSKKEKNKEAA